MTITAHILDTDTARRGALAREVFGSKAHAEIYESVDEMVGRPPETGIILANDDDDENGVAADELIASLRAHNSHLPVVMYARDIEPARIVRAMLSGAVNYLQWPFTAEDIPEALGRTDEAASPLARQMRKQAEAATLVGTLTERERQVLVELVAGDTNKGIAATLAISPRTVEIHRANMMKKLGAATLSGAVRIAILAGLAD